MTESTLKQFFDHAWSSGWLEEGGAVLLAEQMPIPNYPAEIYEENEELQRALTALAIAAFGYVTFRSEQGARLKQSRLKEKSERIVTQMWDEEIHQLAIHRLGREKCLELYGMLDVALLDNHDGEPEAGFDYKVSALELAQVVGNTLRHHGIKLTTTQDGVFVRTLKAIQDATGFKTNAINIVKEVSTIHL